MHERGTSVQDSEHVILEFIEGDHTVIVRIELGHDVSPDLVLILVRTHGGCTTKDLFDLFTADRAIVISIKNLEGPLEVLLREQLMLVERCGEELSIVNVTIAVGISSLHHLHNISFVQIEHVLHLGHVLLELIEGELAIVVDIPLCKQVS